MQAFVVLVAVCCIASCQGADKNYGETCTNKDKCLGDTHCWKYEGCTNGMCSCKAGYIRSTGNTCKQGPKKVGDSCASSNDCVTIAQSECSSSLCKCKDGYSADETTKTQCIKNVGDKCATSNDCTLNMRCDSNVCKCINGFKELHKQCVPFYVGERCTVGTSVCSASGVCKDNTCACAQTDYIGYKNVLCIHKDAKKNLGRGSDCDESNTGASSKYCGLDLACISCPGESKKICGGAGAAKFNLFLILLSSAITFITLLKN